MTIFQVIATLFVAYLALREAGFVVGAMRSGYAPFWSLVGALIVVGIIALGVMVWL